MWKLSRKARFWVSVAFGTASEFIPVPGMLASAIFFPQGIHSDRAEFYGATVLVLNFMIATGAIYGLLWEAIQNRDNEVSARRLSSDRPVKGMIYTESEIEAFKRRGLM